MALASMRVEGDEMEAGDGLRQSLVVAREAPEAGGPGEGTLDHPAAGEQDEAALGLWSADDEQRDAVRACRLGRRRAGIALVDEGEVDGLTGDLLHAGGKLADLGPVLGVGRGDVQG